MECYKIAESHANSYLLQQYYRAQIKEDKSHNKTRRDALDGELYSFIIMFFVSIL